MLSKYAPLNSIRPTIYTHLSSLHNHFRIDSVILSFQIGSNLQGTLFGLKKGQQVILILVKKQGMNLWYLSQDELCSCDRILSKLIFRTNQIHPTARASMSQSSFSTLILHLNDMRPGLPPIVCTNLYTFGFGLTTSRILLSFKRICDPRFNMIKALFVWAT
jgi:hypothetical protein